MPQTYADLQTQALFDDFDAGKYRSVARQAILDAIGEVARSLRLPANEATYTLPLTAGTATYTLPSDSSGVVRILSVYDATNENDLDDVNPDTFDSFATATGVPTAFMLYGSGVQLYPTPAAPLPTITVRYLKRGGVPLNDTDAMADVTGIPEDYLHGLVEYARHRLFRYEDDPDMSQFWLTQWQATLAKLRGDVQRRDVGRKRQIPGQSRSGAWPSFTRPA